jgi:hypothetical protein
MPRWSESEFIKHAQGIAEQHLVSKKSLNEVSQKFAAENNLNPEEIRTLVRLANVATFQRMFQQKDGSPDRMVEFATGDPEEVIRNMVTSASEPMQTANIHNDKLASEVPDLMREKRLGKKFDAPPVETEKLASETEYPEKPAREDIVVMNLRKLASEFTLARITAGAQWEEKLAALTQVFKRAPGYGPKFADFEKQAWADLGSDAAPEMALLYEELKVKHAAPELEKVAFLQERVVVEDTPELKLLRQAHEARQTYLKMAGALAWVDKNMPALGR